MVSVSANRNKPLRVAGISRQYEETGRSFGALVFLDGDEHEIASDPGNRFEVAIMHGSDSTLFEVCRVEGG